MIKFNHVSKSYGNNTVVKDINFEIKEGEFFVLIGPSGSGKTTTLKMINRLIELTDGYIYFKGRPISDYKLDEMRWDIGYVLQQIALFPHMTIKENMMQVPLMKKWPMKKIESEVDRLLNMVGLDAETFKNRYPDELSGGQQQRVGVVRALMADPPLVLMDEPFSALDPISREKLQDDLIKLQNEIHKTIVFVTHDIGEALKLGDRICLMNQGQIEQIDTPEGFINHPKNEFVKSFMGDYLNTHIYARNVMNQDVTPVDVIVQASDPIQVVYKHLASIHKVNVVENGQVIGSITQQDVIKHLSQEV